MQKRSFLCVQNNNWLRLRKGETLMLQIKKLNLTHKKDLRIILNDFNLVLNDGDKAVIIGEEGNGKSTLMKWIYNPSLVENYIEADGERIMGHERLGYLPQEMLDEDKEKTIYEYFSEEEIFWEKTPKELSVIAGKFGMKNDFFYSNQTMGSLSGGEKVKTQLIRFFHSRCFCAVVGRTFQ